MSKYVVVAGQNLQDVAIQVTGSVEGLIDLLALNGLDLADSLTAGQELEIPAVVDADMLDYIKSNSVVIATGQAPDEGAFNYDFTPDFE